MGANTSLTQAAGGALASLFEYLNNSNANSGSVNALLGALGKAQGAIQGGADRAMALQQPYTQNAGNDFLRLRDMVQKGYFQTPMQGSFTSQTPANSGFNFNPSGGNAQFNSFQQQGGPATYTPQGLPQQSAFTPPAQQPYQSPFGQAGGGQQPSQTSSMGLASPGDLITWLKKMANGAVGVGAAGAATGVNVGHDILNMNRDVQNDVTGMGTGIGNDMVKTGSAMGQSYLRLQDAIKRGDVAGIARESASLAADAGRGVGNIGSDVARGSTSAVADVGRGLGGSVMDTGRGADKLRKFIFG